MNNYRYFLKSKEYCYALKDEVAEGIKVVADAVKSFGKVCLAAGAAYSMKRVLDNVCRNSNDDFVDSAKQCVNKVINSIRD